MHHINCINFWIHTFWIGFHIRLRNKWGCFIRKWAKTTNKVSLLAWFCFYTDIANNSAEYLWGWDLSLSLWITFSKAKNLNYLNNITGVKNWGISWQMIIKIFILHTLSNKWFQHQIFSIFSSVQVLGYLFILAGNCIAPAVFL